MAADSTLQNIIPVHRLVDVEFLAATSAEVNFGGAFNASHRIDFFAVIWFTEDADEHYIDFSPYPVRKNTVYLLARNQVHSIPFPYPQAKVIVFNNSFFESIEEDDYRLLFAPFDNSGIVVDGEWLQPLDHLFNLMVLECGNNTPDLKLQRWYMEAFLMQLYRAGNNSANRAVLHDGRLHKLFVLLSTNFKQQKLTAFYADGIGITAKRLNQIVKMRLGKSVSQLIYDYIIIEAKRELLHSAKSIKAIAIELGFNGQSYFSRFFRKMTGLTPEQFRKQEQ